MTLLALTGDEALRRAEHLARNGREDQAERIYRKLIEAAPSAAAVHLALVRCLRRQGRWVEAIAAAKVAKRATGVDPACHYLLATLLLEAGRWAEGFEDYEARRAFAPDAFMQPPAGVPEWNGAAVGSLLVLPEQGDGDAIQFSRYVQAIAAPGVSVTLVCKPSLHRLFAGLGAELRSGLDAEPAAAPEAWAYMASLPRWLGLLPPGRLRAPTFGGSGIGVVWKGNPLHPNDRARSLRGDDARRLAGLGTSLLPEDTGASDYQDTAEIVEKLELVISVDTSVAHLAGALGKPCWLLLPATGSDWRWMRDRTDSPWYPSIRIYRQTRPGDWSGVLDRVEADLRALETGRPRIDLA